MIYKGFSLVVLLTILQSGQGEEYLVAVAYKGKETYTWYIAGETGGLVEIQYPHISFRTSKQLNPHGIISNRVSDKMKITSGVENKAVVVSLSDEDLNIVIGADGVFSPLPISGLGTKYILPSSLAPGSYQSLLLVATHNMTTTVGIFFRMNRGSINFAGYGYNDGNVLSVTLNPYQTLMINTQYDLNGTVITSEHSVAVYSGMEYSSKYTVYDQLLPVKHYGQEYVVAVDDTKLELQIISEHSHAQITFSSGATVSTGERRLYNRLLERGENLQFTATSPVLVTLSRADGYSSSFTTVPPVHLYVTYRSVWLYRNNLHTKLKILTDRRATVLIEDNEVNGLLTWSNIAGSRYKVGTLVQSQSRRIYSTSISSDLPFTVLSFYNGSVYNSGYNLSAEEPVYYSGPSYLMALAGYYMRDGSASPRILASAGETGGQWQVQDPHSGRVWSRRFNPYNTDYFYLNTTTTSVVLVHVGDDAVQVEGGMNRYTSFSPLPVSALGSEYIMSSCLPKTSYSSVLLITTHSKKADIDIIFRLDGDVAYDGRTYSNGDTLSVRLDRYQTFSLNSSSDMTRTIVTATETIAVYSGTYDVRDTVFTTFEQLLPVDHYGHEYVVAIQNPYYYHSLFGSARQYLLQVVTHYSDTNIMFNNGFSISMGDDGVYRKQCGHFETFYFNTTRPTMATMCAFGSSNRYDALVVVPPVSLYSKLTTLEARGILQILTDRKNSYVGVQQTYDTLPTVFSSPVTWKNVSGTRFKVGTLRGGRYTTTIRSNSTFTVLGYDSYFMYSEGYSFRAYPDTVTPVPDRSGSMLNTSVPFQETNTPDRSGIKLNTSALFQAGISSNTTLIMGVACGIVIVTLLVAFIAYVFRTRRTTIPVKKAGEQAADVPSTPTTIYALPDRDAEIAAGDMYTELRFNSTPSDTNIDDSTATYVNVSSVNRNASMSQQC
ncbi:uncharacterized protein [Haliotis asinina]|uniref:uncharacterized protein n=1 Tax=Haliotis asinina TaxID=109174 RepID=UPI00353193F0